jgi:O-antigen/teichoic acid export membrane protein
LSKLVKNTLIYTIGNVLTALSAFLLLPVYTEYMSIDDFGVVNSMQTLSGILIIVITLALDRSLARIYYDYRTEKEKMDFLGTIFISLVFIGIIGTSVCFFSADLLAKLFPKIPFYPYYAYSIVYTFLLLLTSFSQMIAQVKQNSVQFMFISLTLLVFTACSNLTLIVKYNLGALGYVKGMVIGSILIIPFVLYYINKSINYSFNSFYLKAAITFSIPLLPSLLSSWVLNMSDRVFINNYFTESDVGIYSLGYRLASIITFFGSALFMAYNPLFFDIANRNELSETDKKARLYKINKGIILIIGILGLSLLSGSDIILKLFFKKEYLVSYNYISIFALSFIISAISGLLNVMAYQSKKTKLVALIIITCATLNVLLNYMLIPKFGVYFAAINSLICTTVNFILIFFLAKSSFYVEFNWKILSLILFFYVLIYIENRMMMDYSMFLSIPIKVITLLCIILIFKKQILNVVKLIRKKEVAI